MALPLEEEIRGLSIRHVGREETCGGKEVLEKGERSEEDVEKWEEGAVE